MCHLLESSQFHQVENLTPERLEVLRDGEKKLLADEDDGQLDCELHEAASCWLALFLSEGENPHILIWGADKIPLYKSHVED